MVQLARVTNSVFSGIAEASLALANLNFDFSLVKVTAPIEFEGVGQVLSTLRRDAAESGSTHITARKLAALFETVVPPTPILYEAYGRRASEICHHYEENERGVERTGLFADFAGPDATSIWAAATSGKAAIAIHLLACLLARFWKPAESISIWEEIIDVRKKALEDAAKDETFQMATILASQVSLTRDQLAEWDNSARAWLGFADRAQNVQQTKLKLVIDEMQQPIAPKSSLYESVIEAWTVALRGMEELLKGASQGVSHSGLILALSSWHIYPDLSIEGGAPILQRDELFPRGTTLYLNLQGNPNTNKRGIYWSLSLSHMRFYGAPVRTERSYATDSSRITFTQFLHAVLGSTSSQWAIKSPSPLDAARIIRAMVKDFASAPAWMRMLDVAAADMLNSKDSARLLNLKLCRVGRERGVSMLANTRTHPLPVFGLSDPAVFFKCLKTPEYKLKILRKYAERFFPTAKGHEVILKINAPPSWHAKFPFVPQDSVDDSFSAPAQPPSKDTADKDDESRSDENSQSKGTTLTTDESVAEQPGQERSAESETDPAENTTLPGPELSLPVPELRVFVVDEKQTSSEDAGHAPKKSDTGIEYISAFPVDGIVAAHPSSYLHWSYREIREEACLHLGEGHHVHFEPHDWITSDSTATPITIRIPDLQEYGLPSDTEDASSRGLFFGDFGSGAMFVRPELVAQFEAATAGPKWARKLKMKKEIDITDIEEAFSLDEIDMTKWASDMENTPEKRNLVYYRSLTALASAWNLYTHLGEAAVDPAILSRSVMDSAWTKGLKLEFASVIHPDCRIFTRQQAFACIAAFETGGVDLASSELESVMAMSFGESIYVAGPLLSDPSGPRELDKVIRIDGNVGKSGLTLMVPPAEPMIAEANPDSWRVIEREDYDGQVEDCFSRTSLHLSFTNWSVPVSTGAAGRGQRSAEAVLVETLVSVFDRGNWIGDLDALTALRRGYSQPDHEFFYCHTCEHDLDSVDDTQSAPEGIVAIRSWEEFLDRPKNPAVVMSHGNWEARLAAVAMGVARGDRVFFCRGAVCQDCLLKLETFGGEDLVNRALFVA